MKFYNDIKMYADIKMNKKINKDINYISSNGYCFQFKNTSIDFDFLDYIGIIDKKDKNILHIELKNLDIESFPKSIILSDMLCTDELININKFDVCSDSLDVIDIYPIEILNLYFKFDNKKITINNNILKKYIFVNNYI